MHNDDLRPSMVQTTLLLYTTLRMQVHTHMHTCSPPPLPLPPSCLSSQVHAEANSEQGSGPATGITNRNETASPPSSQVRGDPIGAET